MMLTNDKAHKIATLKFENCCCASVLVWSDFHNKILRLAGLNNRHLFSHGSGGWKAKFKVPAAQVSCEDSFSASKMDVITLPFLCVCTAIVAPSSYKGTSSIGLEPHSYGLI